MSQYLRYESLQDNETVGKYLQIMNESLEKGKFLYIDNKDEIILNIEGKIKFEIKARKKEKNVKVFIKFEWHEEAIFSNTPLIIESGE